MMQQQNLDWHTALRSAAETVVAWRAETVVAWRLNLDNDPTLAEPAPGGSLVIGRGEVRVFHTGLNRFLPVGPRNSLLRAL